jgi:hypothetical protein
MKFLSLPEFRATGRDVGPAELEEAAGTELEGNIGGRVYGDGHLYIERYNGAGGSLAYGACLTIMNESWVGDLTTLEALLYAFARDEAMEQPADQQAALIDEWKDFCDHEALVDYSADEVPLHQLNEAQRDYVKQFIARWERSANCGPSRGQWRIEGNAVHASATAVAVLCETVAPFEAAANARLIAAAPALLQALRDIRDLAHLRSKSDFNLASLARLAENAIDKAE